MSGPEKSRHFKHAGAAPGLGFDAIIASRLGRDARGTGGGVLATGAESAATDTGRFDGIGGGEGALLLKPISSADLLGGGGAIIRLTTFDDGVETLVGALLGRVGLSGKGAEVSDCRGGRDGGAGGPCQ